MNKASWFQFLKFTLFSISAGAIQTISYFLLGELLAWPYWPSYLSSLILSIVWNFTFNRRYTFKSAVNVPAAMAKLLGFYAVFTPLSTWLGQVIVDAGVNSTLVFLATLLSNFVLEFLFCKLVVYRGQENTRT